MHRVKDDQSGGPEDQIMSDAEVADMRAQMDADADGRRRLLRLADAEDEKPKPITQECPDCIGGGVMLRDESKDTVLEDRPCPRCEGRGQIPIPISEPDAIPPNAVSPSIIQMDDVVRCRFGLRPDGLQDLIPCKPLREHSRSSAPGVTLIMKKFVEKHPRFGARPPQRFGALLRVVEGDQGVLLNWCPFCGENIHRAFKERARG